MSSNELIINGGHESPVTIEGLENGHIPPDCPPHLVAILGSFVSHRFVADTVLYQLHGVMAGSKLRVHLTGLEIGMHGTGYFLCPPSVLTR